MHKQNTLTTLYNILYKVRDENNPDSYDLAILLAKCYLKSVHLNFVSSKVESEFFDRFTTSTPVPETKFSFLVGSCFDWQMQALWNNQTNALQGVQSAVNGLKSVVDSYEQIGANGAMCSDDRISGVGC